MHVHYEGRQEPLLTECIAPLIAAARTRGLSRWFFLRYWKGGSHVRVRLQFESGTPSDVWDTFLDDIRAYLREKPSTAQIDREQAERSQRMLAALEGEPPGPIVIHPNNSVIVTPYVPELWKYGGPIGVGLAESFFEASSDLVMTILRDTAGKPQGRLGMALAMMLAGLRSAGYTERHIIAWLSAYSRFCERYVAADAWRSWQSKLMQRPEVLKQINGNAPLDGSVRSTPAWLRGWADTFGAAARALHDHEAAVKPAVTMARTMDPLQFVLFNYLHTHHNRLGVAPALEAQVAYIAYQILAHQVRAETAEPCA